MKYYTLDLETCQFKSGDMAPKIVCITIDNEIHVSNNELKRILESDSYIVGHNIAYDMACIMSNYPSLMPLVFDAYKQNRVLDTMLFEQLINIAIGDLKKSRYNLKYIADKRCGIILTKDETQISFELVMNTPLKDWPERFKKYALEDVEATKEVFINQIEENTKYKYVDFKHLAFQARAYFALQLMSVYGLITDDSSVSNLKAGLLFEEQDLIAKVRKLNLIKDDGSKNVNILKDLVREDFELRGEEPPTTEKGNIKYGKEVLEKCTDERLIDYADLSHTQKIITTYIPILELPTIHPGYSIAETGRTTSFNPPIQTLPKKGNIRECFIPRPGFLYCDIDYDAIELKALAQVCLWLLGWSELANVFAEGKDPHLATAANILGISYEEAYKNRFTEKVENARQLAKAANFGYPGGMGYKTFPAFAKGYRIIISISESEALRNAWFQTYPEMESFLDLINKRLNTFGECSVIQPVTERVRGKCYFNSACNSYFQGLVSDGAKEALFNSVHECYNNDSSVVYGCKPIAFIHDEILFEVHEDDYQNEAEELTKIMCSSMQKYIPDIEITAQPAIMRRWYKKAKSVYKDGKLLIWEPKED